MRCSDQRLDEVLVEFTSLCAAVEAEANHTYSYSLVPRLEEITQDLSECVSERVSKSKKFVNLVRAVVQLAHPSETYSNYYLSHGEWLLELKALLNLIKAMRG
jgi:hypothetical protein